MNKKYWAPKADVTETVNVLGKEINFTQNPLFFDDGDEKKVKKFFLVLQGFDISGTKKKMLRARMNYGKGLLNISNSRSLTSPVPFQ